MCSEIKIIWLPITALQIFRRKLCSQRVHLTQLMHGCHVSDACDQGGYFYNVSSTLWTHIVPMWIIDYSRRAAMWFFLSQVLHIFFSLEMTGEYYHHKISLRLLLHITWYIINGCRDLTWCFEIPSNMSFFQTNGGKILYRLAMETEVWLRIVLTFAWLSSYFFTIQYLAGYHYMSHLISLYIPSQVCHNVFLHSRGGCIVVAWLPERKVWEHIDSLY